MKRITIQGLLSLATFTLFFTANSFGQNTAVEEKKQPKTVDEVFTEMDLNKDSQISIDEAKEPYLTNFDKIDLNEDGFISREELTQSIEPEENRLEEKK